MDPHGLCHDQGIRSHASPAQRTGSPLVPAARHQGRGAPCGESFWHWALGADGGHGHAQPPFRSSRLIGAERQPTSDSRQSSPQTHFMLTSGPLSILILSPGCTPRCCMNSLRSVICPLEVKVYAFIAALLRPKFVRGNHLKVNVCTAIVKRLDLVVAPTAAIHVNVQDAPTNGDVSDRASGSPAKLKHSHATVYERGDRL